MRWLDYYVTNNDRTLNIRIYILNLISILHSIKIKNLVWFLVLFNSVLSVSTTNMLVYASHNKSFIVLQKQETFHLEMYKYMYYEQSQMIKSAQLNAGLWHGD